ncbi:MAG: helix-turn-helix transcriptional regulator [Lachnospiraceae bacterium]|nr:helix-turn-helix transcriptional regulator [Lachnospiraceae bacterium]
MGTFYVEVGKRIRKVRKLRGYTGKTLATMAGISQKFLSEIENGKKGFSSEVLYNISKALEIEADYILSGDEDKLYDEEIASTISLFETEDKEQIIRIMKEISRLL